MVDKNLNFISGEDMKKKLETKEEENVNIKSGGTKIDAIIKYIKDRAKRNSPFYEAAGNEVSKGKGLDKYNIRKEFIIRNFYEDLTIDKKTGRPRETENGDIIVSNADIYRIINSFQIVKEFLPCICYKFSAKVRDN